MRAALEGVLEHNRLDLLALAMITARAAQLLDEGAAGGAHRARGARSGPPVRARRPARRGARVLRPGHRAGGRRPRRTPRRCRAYAVLCRRERRYDDAADAWRRMLRCAGARRGWRRKRPKRSRSTTSTVRATWRRRGGLRSNRSSSTSAARGHRPCTIASRGSTASSAGHRRNRRRCSDAWPWRLPRGFRMLFAPAVPDGFEYPRELHHRRRRNASCSPSIERLRVLPGRDARRRRQAPDGRISAGPTATTRGAASPDRRCPAFLLAVRARIAAWAGIEAELFVEALVTEYPAGCHDRVAQGRSDVRRRGRRAVAARQPAA